MGRGSGYALDTGTYVKYDGRQEWWMSRWARMQPDDWGGGAGACAYWGELRVVLFPKWLNKTPRRTTYK